MNKIRYFFSQFWSLIIKLTVCPCFKVNSSVCSMDLFEVSATLLLNVSAWETNKTTEIYILHIQKGRSTVMLYL